MDFLVDLVGIFIILGIVYILYKKGVIRNARFPVIKSNFTYNHSGSKGNLRLRYGKYNGVSNFMFKVNPGERTELQYDVEVVEGSLVLSFGLGKEKVLDKEFFESSAGRVSFVPRRSVYFIVVTGKHTKGGCTIQLERVD